MISNVITRFAPSPTGYLHIGSARTALFNLLYAKCKGGKMLLRIEDTDRERYNKDSVKEIINGLKWLDINWDENIIYQFNKSLRHIEIANELILRGMAYYCYLSPKKFNDENNKLNFESIYPAIRMKIPKCKKTIVNDLIKGRVCFLNKDLKDFVIVRSNGLPTYMLSVVVDDYDMGVTHIIRGDDHFTNSAKQIIIYNAMGWQIPKMAHIPLIHDKDGHKLSKRRNPVNINDYQNMGFIPEAICNYLLRLGWSYKDKEIFSRQEMIKLFNIENIHKNPARFDMKKLSFINSHYINLSTSKYLINSIINIIPSIKKTKYIINDINNNNCIKFYKSIPILKKRSKTLIEIINNAEFIFFENNDCHKEYIDYFKQKQNNILFKDFIKMIKLVNPWKKSILKESINKFLKDRNIFLKDIAHIIRLSLTGKIKSIGIFDILIILGKKDSINRIQKINKNFSIF